MKTILLLILCMGSFAEVFSQDQSTWSNDVNVNPQPGKYYRNERVAVAFDGTIYVGHIVSAAPNALTNQFEILRSFDGGASYDTFAYTGPFLHPHTRLTAFDMATVGNDSASFKLIFSRAYVDTAVSSIDTITLTIDTFNLYFNTGTAQYVEKFNSYDPYHRGYTSISIATDTRDANSYASPYYACIVAVKSGPQDSIVVFAEAPNANDVAERKVIYASFNEIRTVSASIGSADFGSSAYGRLGIAWDEFDYHFDTFGSVKAAFVYPDDVTLPTNTGPFVIGGNDSSYRRPSICLSQQGGHIGTAGNDIRAIVAYEYKSSNGDIDLYARVADSIVYLPSDFSDGFVINDATGIQKSVHSVYEPNSDKFFFTYFDATNNTLPCVTKHVNANPTDNPVSLNTNYRNATTAINTDPAPRVDIRVADGKPAFVWNDNYETYFDAEYLTTSVVGAVNVEEMKLYPNPANSLVNMSFTSTVNDRATIAVYDMTGRQITSVNAAITEGANTIAIDLQQMPAGNYLLKLKGNNTDITSKFVIIK